MSVFKRKKKEKTPCVNCDGTGFTERIKPKNAFRSTEEYVRERCKVCKGKKFI